jgi:hypothetical protein
VPVRHLPGRGVRHMRHRARADRPERSAR